MDETPKEVLDEYGISEVIARYITSSEAEEVLDEYIYTPLNRINFLQEKNKRLKAFVVDNELDLLPEYKNYFDCSFR
ncbi:COG5 family protein [Robertmurraya siralis]|uniref:hypothetical protein n=1 Tax=Robertmurraya siralis TaxID=77777 RepID=UPI0010F798DD|nr:hypothetical protein [Robertmurraya siralis]